MGTSDKGLLPKHTRAPRAKRCENNAGEKCAEDRNDTSPRKRHGRQPRLRRRSPRRVLRERRSKQQGHTATPPAARPKPTARPPVDAGEDVEPWVAGVVRDGAATSEDSLAAS